VPCTKPDTKPDRKRKEGKDKDYKGLERKRQNDPCWKQFPDFTQTKNP
jgi:hypothetical protein